MYDVLAVGGESVFLTSLTNFCAFMIASITPVPAVQVRSYNTITLSLTT